MHSTTQEAGRPRIRRPLTVRNGGSAELSGAVLRLTSVCVHLQRLDVSARHEALLIFLLVHIDVLDIILFVLHRQPAVACRGRRQSSVLRQPWARLTSTCSLAILSYKSETPCVEQALASATQLATRSKQASERTDNCQVPLTMVMTEAPIILLLGTGIPARAMMMRHARMAAGPGASAVRQWRAACTVHVRELLSVVDESRSRARPCTQQQHAGDHSAHPHRTASVCHRLRRSCSKPRRSATDTHRI